MSCLGSTCSEARARRRTDDVTLVTLRAVGESGPPARWSAATRAASSGLSRNAPAVIGGDLGTAWIERDVHASERLKSDAPPTDERPGESGAVLGSTCSDARVGAPLTDAGREPPGGGAAAGAVCSDRPRARGDASAGAAANGAAGGDTAGGGDAGCGCGGGGTNVRRGPSDAAGRH